MAQWNACTAGQPDYRALRKGIRNRQAFGGVDLASSQDIAAAVLVLPGDDDTFEIVPFFLDSRGTAGVTS